MNVPARITAHAVAFLTTDFARAKAFWTDQLGFTVVGTWGDPEDFGIFAREEARVMVGATRAGETVTPLWRQRAAMPNAYFWVNDARAMFDEVVRRGATIDYDLYEAPYGVLEFGVQDPDGHDIAFGEVLGPDPAG